MVLFCCQHELVPSQNICAVKYIHSFEVCKPVKLVERHDIFVILYSRYFGLHSQVKNIGALHTHVCMYTNMIYFFIT